MPPIDTAKVTDRRVLRFKTPDEAVRDAEALVAADVAGTLRRTGNWTLGQALGHLASWINYSFDGFPIRKPPFFIRWILKGRKSRFITSEMPRGVKIPGVKGGTAGTEVLSTNDGWEKFRAAWERLRTTCPTQESLIFGQMTHHEWTQLNLRHAELHLGYFHPAGKGV